MINKLMESQKKHTHGIAFKTIKFRNFLSFGNIWTEIDLDQVGTTFIMGENLDDGGSSGAGKSTLINAIAYCLYDKIPSGVSKDNLINLTNEKKNTSMEVVFTFIKDELTYTVNRWRGATTGVQLFVTDADGVMADITPASVNRGADSFNAKIEDLLGFSFNLFSQIILFNGNSTPFLDLSVGSQRSLIEELFKITTLTRKAVALKQLIVETDKSIAMQKVLIKQQITQNETRQRLITEAIARADRWESTRQAELTDAQARLEEALLLDFDTEETLHAEIQRLMQLNAPKQAELRLISGDVAKVERDLKKLEEEIVHLRDAKCPYCLQSYASAADKLIELTSKQEELNVKLNQHVTDLADKQLESVELSNLLTESRSCVTHASLAELLKVKNSMHAMQTKLVSLADGSNPHIEAVEALQNEAEIVVDTVALDELVKLQEHQQFLLKLLTDKNSFIRKNIIARTIPFLNKQIAFYTEKLLLPHIVSFQPDMTCQITQYGRKLAHGNLSNGEKKRLNVSLCLAFRDTLTYLHSHVNVLFTDEIDGGSLDANCVESMIGMLKQKSWDDDVSIFIISHRPEFEGRCDRNLVVRKDRGFSSLIVQPEE